MINKVLYRFCVICFKVTALLLVYSPALGQSPEMDSLKTALKETKDPVKRIEILNSLSYKFIDYNDSLALDYAHQALEQAVRIKYLRGQKYAHTLLGLGYYRLTKFDEAFLHLRLSEKMEVTDATELTAFNLSIIGSVYRELANYDSARYYYMKVVELGEDKVSNGRIGIVYKNLGQLDVILWNNADAITWLRKAERLAVEDKDLYLQAEVYSYLGAVYENLLDYTLAEQYFNKLCDLASQQVFYYHLIKCELRKAELLHNRGLYAEALSTCMYALELTDKYDHAPHLAEVYQAIGDVYTELGEYDLALQYYFKGLQITERIGLRLNSARIDAQIAWVYKQQSNFDLALRYCNRSLEIRMQIGDRHGISNSYNYRGLIYYQMKRYHEAAADLKASRTLREKIGHVDGIASATFNLSLVYEDLAEYQKSYELLKEVIELETRMSKPDNLGITYNQMGKLLTKMNRMAEAREFLDKAAAKAIEAQSILLRHNNSLFYAQWYAASGNYKRAYENQVLYQQLNDSIYNRSVATKLAEMEAMYRVEQKEQQIKLLNQENELQHNKLALQQSRIRSQGISIVLSLIGLGLITVLAVFIYMYNRRIRRANFEILEQKEEIQTQAEELVDANEVLVQLNREVTEKNEEIQAQSEELIEANQTIYEINKGLEEKINERTNRLKEAYKELDTFFYRASHDFRRPLTTFMGLAEVARITIKDNAALGLFEKVDETAHTLDRMLVKLQSISDVGAQQLVYKEVFISELINDILDNFREEIQSKNVKVNTKINLKDSFYSYPAMVKIVLDNLVENATQFGSPDNPIITITVEQEGPQVFIRVTDNGQGVEEEVQDKIFDMYFRGSDRSKGNGLGLYIAKKAVEKLSGTISVSSKVYAGSTFTVMLPVGNSTGM